jgi:hypothetical protein
MTILGGYQHEPGTEMQNDEPFIFSLIREHLPHDDQESGEEKTVSKGTVYGLMALVTLGVLASWFLFGIAPTR